MLVTAGPTYEAIDPVRFIGNHSSGKMGFAIADQFASEGADVILIAGPVAIECKNKTVQRFNVTTAQQMYDACMKHSAKADVVVMAAAVADYTPVKAENKKIKKKEDTFQLNLKKNPDILAEMGKRKKKGQFLCGFALETNDEIENALKKLYTKKLDLIVLNSMKDAGAGFGYDTNKITLADASDKILTFELKSKEEVAADIVSYIISKIKLSGI